jgi:hypothetical protein
MSKTQGIRLLEECWGWNITRHIDGRLTMLCAHCVQRTTGCAIGRHDWFEPELDFNAPVAERPVELCRCCRIVRRDYEPLNVPPAGHPDTMRHLCDADEAVLKRYAAQFSQEVI